MTASNRPRVLGSNNVAGIIAVAAFASVIGLLRVASDMASDIAVRKLDRAVADGVGTGAESFRLLVRVRDGAVERVAARWGDLSQIGGLAP